MCIGVGGGEERTEEKMRRVKYGLGCTAQSRWRSITGGRLLERHSYPTDGASYCPNLDISQKISIPSLRLLRFQQSDRFPLKRQARRSHCPTIRPSPNSPVPPDLQLLLPAGPSLY